MHNQHEKTFCLCGFVHYLIKKADDQRRNRGFFLVGEGLPSVGDKLVVLSSAGIGAVLSEVIHFSSDSDIGLSGGFVAAIFGKLFSLAVHRQPLKKCTLHFFNGENQSANFQNSS